MKWPFLQIRISLLKSHVSEKMLLSLKIRNQWIKVTLKFFFSGFNLSYCGILRTQSNIYDGAFFENS